MRILFGFLCSLIFVGIVWGFLVFGFDYIYYETGMLWIEIAAGAGWVTGFMIYPFFKRN